MLKRKKSKLTHYLSVTGVAPGQILRKSAHRVFDEQTEAEAIQA